MSFKLKLFCYLLLGMVLAFIVFVVILAVLGDQSKIVEENEKLKEQRKKILNLLNMWNGNINSIFEQQLLDILKGDEDNEIISIQSENSGQEEER